jgi:putative two-component system response regulator
MAEEIALNHHERWDGSGYPRGLRGAEIPRSARIVAVVDVFDALTHHRPYKAAWPMDDAVAELQRQRNMQFDPDVVDAFIEVHAELKVELLEGHAAHG